MSGEVKALFQQALNLPPDERYQLAQQLLDSLDGDDLLPDDPEFRAELSRRLEEAEKHPDRLLDGEAVMAELREHLRKKRSQ